MLLPALAFVVGGVALAAYQPADAAPETAYLTLLGGWTLGGAALFAPARSRLGAAAALLAAMALWALPAGPVRGAAFGVVLVAAVCAAGWARLRIRELDLAAAMGGALAVHALLRAGELLPARLGLAGEIDAGAAAELARAVGPPLLAGWAVALLARQATSARAIGTAVVAALAAGGFTVTAAVALLALAVAMVGHKLGHHLTTREIVAATAAAVALTVMRPAAGGLALAAAGALLLAPRVAWIPAAVLLAIAAVASMAADWVRVLPAVAVLFVLVPFAFTREGAPLPRIGATILLAAAGGLLLPGTAGVTAAAALLVLMRPAAAASALQRGWSGVLLALAALAAGYPWLREPLRGAFDLLAWQASGGESWDPLRVAFDWLATRFSTGVLGVIVPAAAAIAGAWLLLAVARRASLRRAGALLAAVVAVAVLVAMPRPAWNVLPPEGVVLRADAPEWSGPGNYVGRVRVVSSLAGAGDLAPGTPVATLTVERTPGLHHVKWVNTLWVLRAGDHTGEWAADRPDLRGAAPRGPVWWSWLPPPGTFFAHAYAATWTLSRPVIATRVRIVRAADLPPEVTVSLQRVEVGF